MSLLTPILLFQLAAPARQVAPTLAFPEVGLDDTIAYQGYQTRFFKDFAGNTVQIYVDNRSGRVVHLADGENESIGFVRDQQGRPARANWASPRAEVSGNSRSRTLAYDLQANAPRISIGWFLLGSMRVERDFQYSGRHKTPFASPPFALPEMERLLTALNRLDTSTQKQHLSYVNAAACRHCGALTHDHDGFAQCIVGRASFSPRSMRDTLVLELRVNRRV
jgi:hypothetical protein